MLRVLGRWQARDGLRGLPIGPEVSAVLGNAFLMPVDRTLRRHGTYLRWMDDLFIFGASVEACEEIIEPLDDALDGLGLTRSDEKTWFFENRRAIAFVQDEMLTSLGYELKFLGKIESRELLHAAFDQYVMCDDVEKRHLRYIVNAMKFRSDPYAAIPFVENPHIMNTDPRLSVEYLQHIGLAGCGKARREHENLFA